MIADNFWGFMFQLRHFIFALALFSMCSLTVQANTFEAETGQVKAQLIASVDAVHPGDEILVGVHQRIIPHWHTYWINPGDSGLPTTIDYALPGGAIAGEIQWPTPTRIIMGSITNFGYENEVTLISKIKVPLDSIIGNGFPVNAKVKWLVCEETCIPQKVDLKLVLPIILPGTVSGAGSPLIKAALASLRMSSPWAISLTQGKSALTLRMTDARLQSAAVQNIRFYPNKWGKVIHGAEQPWQHLGNTIELKLKPGDEPLVLLCQINWPIQKPGFHV